MRDDRKIYGRYVLGNDVVASENEGICLSYLHERERRTGTCFEADLIAASRRTHERYYVFCDLGIDLHGGAVLYHLRNIICTACRGDRVERVLRPSSREDRKLFFLVGISHRHPDRKTVELCFGQGIRSDISRGVLCRNDEERIGETVRYSVNGHAVILHRFEKARLCFR